MSDLRNQISGPWLLLGDFNEILNPNEVSGGNFSSSRAYLLANMMSACGVMDLDSVGGWFTWRKNVQSSGHVRKKLDRCMDDSEWQVLFRHALLEVLPMHNSYHNPLLLSCLKSRSKRVKSFHFQATWLSHPEYPNLVTNTWNSTQGNVYNKLHKVQVESTKLNEKVFGNIFKRKRHLDARIKGVHKKLDIFPYSGLIILERKLQALYNQVLHQEEVLWFQKSREQWIKFGNKNTKFFHTQTIIRRRRNKISGINIDGIWCTNDEVIKREVLSFFRNLFQSSNFCQPECLQLHHIPQVDQDLYNSLIQNVSMEDVKNAMFSMNSYKAPGVDGFQPVFYKNFWNVVANDVWEMVSMAFSSRIFNPGLAETPIIPIPKIDSPLSFKDFRPTRLCNVLFKTISKVLVNRIRLHLDKIIGLLQSSSIPKRGTSDNALTTQEIVHHFHKKKKGKKGHVMFKIDFEKAYDRVDWNFLRLTLIDFGFPSQIVNLIMNCITSTTLTLKWNSEKLESFAPKRGLRQGDPMSPYLFVLCMEKISLLIQQKS